MHFYCVLFGYYANLYYLCTLLARETAHARPLMQASWHSLNRSLATDFAKYTYLYIIMAELEVKELDQVVVRFSGDSGDGMQLAGNITSVPRKVR